MISDNLSKNKDVILNRWREAIIASYSPDSAIFLKNQNDRFANPVGYTISTGTSAVLQVLLGGKITDSLEASLEHIIRIRSVQDFAPSQATYFLFQLKQIIRAEIDITGPDDYKELAALEERIDRLALMAFDIYTRCREQIYDLRVREIKARAFRILKDSDIIGPDFKQEGNSADGKI